MKKIRFIVLILALIVMFNYKSNIIVGADEIEIMAPAKSMVVLDGYTDTVLYSYNKDMVNVLIFTRGDETRMKNLRRKLSSFAAIAIVILALYFVCWLFSKKHVAFMIAALVLFVIDTVAMFILFVPALSIPRSPAVPNSSSL